MIAQASCRSMGLVTVEEHARQARSALGEQIIDGMGGPGDVLELFGDEGTAKTRLALNLAHALTCRSSWGPFRINRNGKVLLLETDMPDVAQGGMTEGFIKAGYFTDGRLLTFPFDKPTTLYHVENDQSVLRLCGPENLPSDLVAVIIDTWSSLFSVAGGPQNAYMESVIRAVVGQLRFDYPTALLVALNHTTGAGAADGVRSLSPGLRRIATTRYKVVAPTARDVRGRWDGSGLLLADGKFSRSDKLPRRVPLRWDWKQHGDPAPHPTLDGLESSEWLALFPHVEGLIGNYSSRNEALRDLSRVSGHDFEAFKSAQRRHPNPALAALGGDRDG